jgi:predicted DsbA family dithiol-disulfide isomerase
MRQKKLTILHFSDVLCIWAYIAQIRIDELRNKFGTQIELEYHFMPVFGSTQYKFSEGWKNRGGFAGYNQHILKLGEQFEHIDIHPEIWMKNIPLSSISCHLFLKSIQILERRGELEGLIPADSENTPIESAVKEFRRSFFSGLVNIAELQAQIEIAEKLNFPVTKIIDQIQNGAAYAELDQDLQIRDKYVVKGSPTLIFNEGRQSLYGNVGYSVIEANVRELLHHGGSQASWC